MLNKANPKLIGSFVLGALLLLVATLLLFGSGAWFRPRHTFIGYFGGSVQGLDVGSPVRFRGVRVGQVKDIELQYLEKENDFRIRVLIEITGRGEEEDQARTLDLRLINILIKKGLRAQLVSESFITGRLFINLDFFPDEPLRLVADQRNYAELPTIPTDLEKLQSAARNFYARLSELPLEEIVLRLNRVLQNVETVTGSTETLALPGQLGRSAGELEALLTTLNTETPATLAEVRAALTEGRRVLDRLDSDASSITTALVGATGEASVTMKSVRDQLTFGSGPLGELAGGFNESAAALRATLTQAEATLVAIEQSAGPRSELNSTLAELLRELTQTARSVRELTDYLERHPEAMLKGKP